MRRSPWMFMLLLLLVILTACGGAQPAAPAVTSVSPVPVATNAPAPTAVPEPTAIPAPTAAPATQPAELTVFAAASLTDAFKAIGQQFGAANGATVTFNFAGSDQLATQINQGAPSDVFASANTKQMDVVIQAGEVVSGTQRAFARNRLVVVYPKDNPGGLAVLKDLAKPGLKVVLANKSVPVGGYALDFLSKASKLPEYTVEFSPTVLKNVVSYEENVKAVLSKITLGEADAGIVYTTDAATVTDGSIGMLDIPDNLNTIATYPIAATKNAKNPELAKKFVDYVLGPEGQQVLVKYGFIPNKEIAHHNLFSILCSLFWLLRKGGRKPQELEPWDISPSLALVALADSVAKNAELRYTCSARQSGCCTENEPCPPLWCRSRPPGILAGQVS